MFDILFPIAATLSGFGLVVGAWLYFHKQAPRVTTFLFLCAGVVLGGWLGSLIGTALTLPLGQLTSLTGRFLGVGAGLIAGLGVIAVVEVVVHGILPIKKLKGKPKRWHPLAALVLPTLVAVAGVPALSIGLLTQPAVLFVLGLYFYVKKVLPRVTTLLWLVGGFVISGVLGAVTGDAVAAAVGQLGSIGARFTGFAAAALVSGVAAVWTAEVLIKGASPLKGKWLKSNPKRYHPPLALALPTVVVAAGAPVLSNLLTSLSSVVI